MLALLRTFTFKTYFYDTAHGVSGSPSGTPGRAHLAPFGSRFAYTGVHRPGKNGKHEEQTKKQKMIGL